MTLRQIRKEKERLRKESIEELAKVFNCVWVPRHYCPIPKDCTTCLAETVYDKLGYRKVDEDHVVVPKHNPHNKTFWAIVPDELWWFLADARMAVDDIRRETSTEILCKLKETLIVNNEENTEFFDYAFTLDTIDEIAKEYGVEIDL